jgi:hypothetical protein
MDADAEGLIAPATAAEAREQYDALGTAARTVVREIAKAMSFDREEYDERVTGEVVGTARDALFASLLEVRVGSRGTFESWREAHEEPVHVVGSEHVERVVWHAGPGGEAVAATFQDERDAAVATLRRQAFGRLYREVVRE